MSEENEKNNESAREEFNTKPNQDSQKQNKPPVDSIKAFEELVAVSQVKDVKLPDDANSQNSGPKTLSESFDEATDQTDMQYAAGKLFPKKTKLRDVQIGRIFPDAFLPLIHLAVDNEIMTKDPTLDIDPNEAIVTSYIDFGIGLDGQGRIDLAELLGAAKEQKREENLLAKGI